MTVLKGLSAFPITPSDADGRVNAVALRNLLTPLIEAKVNSIGLLGSTGSYPYLSRAERRRALERDGRAGAGLDWRRRASD
jgi:4-hydroxy-tetrahydrodipicolinate synthase